MVFIVVFSKKRAVACIVLVSATCKILPVLVLSVWHCFNSCLLIYMLWLQSAIP
jgi:hypothetical protein